MASPLAQPIQFGKYTLFERIGRGGMADVFKGRIQGPAGFERVFVVKRILPHLSDDPTFNKMFVEEAKMSARLNHPNIVQVFELGSVEGEYFISMEYVRGRDLAETMRVLWARIGPPRPELVAYIGREMCRALAYAHNLTDEQGHQLGMIHRDVSPSNVMLSYEGGVKLLDFGIAKALGDAKKEENTRTGTLKGKFAYMAPEQTEGNDVDKRIDIFAGGIVLHEVLTGRRLFKGANDLQTIERVRQCQVDPPSAQNPLCPPELDGVVLKALSRDRENRYQSAAEMADALDDVVHAARFQPDHLAQLMRELFPTDAAPGTEPRPATGSVNVGQMTASASRSPVHRPPSISPSTSPSVPPVSVSRSMSPSRPPPLDLESLKLPRAKPLWQRPPIIGGAAGVLLLVVILAFASRKSAVKTPPSAAANLPQQPVQTQRRRPPDGKIKVSVESRPAGADVFIGAQTTPVGKTPGTFQIPWDDERDTRVIVRKAGFRDYATDIRPSADQPIVAGLTPASAAGPSQPQITQSETPKASSSSHGGSHRSSSSRGSSKKGGGKKGSLRKGGLVDPF